MKTKIKIAIIFLLLCGIAAVAIMAVRDAEALPIASAASFDYSGCQYPTRTANHDGLCDNSDPCDPAQVKGGSGGCLPTPDKDPAANLPDPDRDYYDGQGNKYDYQGNIISTAPVEAATVSSCSGK